MTTKKVHWGFGKEIIDFEESLLETRWGAKNMNLMKDYVSENSMGIQNKICKIAS